MSIVDVLNVLVGDGTISSVAITSVPTPEWTRAEFMAAYDAHELDRVCLQDGDDGCKHAACSDCGQPFTAERQETLCLS